MPIEKNLMLRATLVAVLALAPLGGARAADDAGAGPDTARARIGLEIAPVPLAIRGRDRLLVGLGSYIVNAQASCNDCHTHPSFAAGGDPYAGQPEVINAEQYLAGGRLFGPFRTSNLTPDEHGLPAGLTWPEFREVLRRGHDPAGSGRLLQVMPWSVLGKMAERDLRAVYEYLRAIPSRPDNPRPGP